MHCVRPATSAESEVREGRRDENACVLQVCEREQSDKKGGHLARRKADGRLV